MIQHTEAGGNPTTEDLHLLDAYRDAGFKMVRLDGKTKKGFHKAWQKLDPSVEDVRLWLEGGGSVGLLAGERSGWLAFVDLDDPWTRSLAPYFLSNTLTAGKELEELPSHYAYIAEGLGYARFYTCEGKELMSIKTSSEGKGHQCAVEPSVHATKGRYQWTGGFDASKITRISPEVLEEQIAKLAAAALIGKYLPDGGR